MTVKVDERRVAAAYRELAQGLSQAARAARILGIDLGLRDRTVPTAPDVPQPARLAGLTRKPAARLGRPPMDSTDPRLSKVLKEMRALRGWTTPMEVARRLDEDWSALRVRSYMVRLVEDELVEHNGKNARASKYRAIPVEAWADMDHHVRKGVTLKVGNAAREAIFAGGGVTEQDLVERIRVDVPAADREVVAQVCGELLEEELVRLAADGTYWPGVPA